MLRGVCTLQPFLEPYAAHIKGALEALEAEFGNDVSAWPGDPSITWRRS
jgi:hypothetical protein